MNDILKADDFPLRAANGFVLKADGSAVAWCPSTEVAQELVKRLLRDWIAEGLKHGFGGVLGTVQRSPAEVAAMAPENYLENFNEVFTAERTQVGTEVPFVTVWPPAVDRDKFGG